MKRQLLKIAFTIVLLATANETVQAQCDVVNVPYANGFESTNNLTCFTYEDLNGGFLSGWALEDTFSTHAGEGSMMYTYDSDLPGDDWFFTPGLQLTAGISYEISFRYRSALGDEGLFENFAVDYGTAPAAAAMSGVRLVSYENIDTNFNDDFALTTVTVTPEADGAYYIGFHCFSEADQGYLQIDDIAVNATLATNGFDKNAFTFSPNPVKDVLHFSNNQKVTGISVYNLLGQSVLVKNSIQNGTLDLSGLSAGAYVLKVNSGNSVKTIKIIKE